MINIEKHLKSAGRIKLHGGVVGKTCTVLIVLILTIGGLAAVSREPWIVASAIFAVSLIVFVMLWRLIDFARANPEAAILEGAEFLAHTQITMASKSVPALPAEPHILAKPMPSISVMEELSNGDESDKEGEK